MPNERLLDEIEDSTVAYLLKASFTEKKYFSIKKVEVVYNKRKIYWIFTKKDPILNIIVNESEHVAETLIGNYQLTIEEIIEGLFERTLIDSKRYEIKINYV